MTDESPRTTPRDATIEANSDSGLARPGDTGDLYWKEASEKASGMPVATLV